MVIKRNYSVHQSDTVSTNGGRKNKPESRRIYQNCTSELVHKCFTPCSPQEPSSPSNGRLPRPSTMEASPSNQTCGRLESCSMRSSPSGRFRTRVNMSPTSFRTKCAHFILIILKTPDQYVHFRGRATWGQEGAAAPAPPPNKKLCPPIFQSILSHF